MNIRFRFLRTAACIALLLAGLLAFQSYWLKGLYDTLYIQMESNVREAMRMADYQELFLRIVKVKEKERKEGKSINHYVEVNPTDSIVEPPSAGQAASSTGFSIRPGIPDDSLTLSAAADSSLANYLNVINRLESYIQTGIHQQIDNLLPIDFNTYGKRLHEELLRRNIQATAYLFVSHSAMPDAQTFLRIPVGMEPTDSLSIASLSGDFFVDYPLYGEQTLTYRLYLRHPSAVVLRQMSGLLGSSFLLLLLIVGAFIYLLRTILRQKTMEELKTDFTNNMTHELKTPIAVSYSALDALLNFDTGLSERQRKYLGIVKEQMAHLTGLVEQILSLAVENRSTFRLHKEPLPLREMAEQLCQQFSLKADKPLHFTLDIPPALRLTADKTHLYNILSNLLDNAFKYNDKPECRIRIEAGQERDAIYIKVEDNGIGISEANLPKLFDKFFRVPDGNRHNVKGYGLGLYYVKEMMEKHGGNVTAESHPGRGSSFILHFPLPNGQ